MNHLVREGLSWIAAETDQLRAANLWRQRRVRTGRLGATVHLDGKPLVNLGSNDYLDLADDPRLAVASIEASREYGWGAGASGLVCGRHELHARLETELARFEETEAAILFPTGYAANSGTIPALVGRGDAVFSDARNHASIIDGCRLSRADVHIYRHVDPEHLRELLRAATGYRRRLIVTDTLFSMDGNLAPLRDLAELAEGFDCILMVDEAHATGVFGERGRGVAEHLGVEKRIDVRVGTLSKALASQGGFVAGSHALIDWLANRARTYVFSTAPPPALAAAALAALRIVRDEPHRRLELLARADRLRRRLRDEGHNTGRSASQIVPLIVGDAAAAVKLAEGLREKGLFVPAIRPPSVPSGESLLRISLCWGIDDLRIDEIVRRPNFP